MTVLASPRLSEIARHGPAEAIPDVALCELCAVSLAAEHRHLLELPRRALLCTCRACAVLFDRRDAGARRFRLVPERGRRIVPFDLDEPLWQALSVPVRVAFFARHEDGEVIASYPSPLGTTEARPDVGAWTELVARNPALTRLEDEVEALLVRRGRRDADEESYLVPIDAGYRLTGLMRRHWRGLAGGEHVWEEVARFFEVLRKENER